ncbi:MAG: XTP/dITP diphosphatase [Verrucomicrobia bacterium]|nr:XTP/dITP diphosphatase [Verrucomicrobiota bacterium]
MELFVATRNRNKVRELQALLEDTKLTLCSFRDFRDLPEVEEDGRTFEENATKKAVALAKYTGLLTIADDSGLEVDALDGQPGVMSARYAGPDATDKENNEKLLAQLRNVPEGRRAARFRCAIALATPAGLIAVVEGVCEGRIALEERGTEGFGYDPLFVKDDSVKTFAELPLEVKNRVSHRALALEKALLVIENYLLTRDGKGTKPPDGRADRPKLPEGQPPAETEDRT